MTSNYDRRTRHLAIGFMAASLVVTAVPVVRTLLDPAYSESISIIAVVFIVGLGLVPYFVVFVSAESAPLWARAATVSYGTVDVLFRVDSLFFPSSSTAGLTILFLPIVGGVIVFTAVAAGVWLWNRANPRNR